MGNNTRSPGNFRPNKRDVVKRAAALVLFFFIWPPFTLGDIIAQGEIIIPAAIENKRHQATITFTYKAVKIQCRKRVFRPFNETAIPKRHTLIVPYSEIIIISRYRNKIYIRTNTPFYRKYRHLHHEQATGGIWSAGGPMEFELTLTVEKAEDLKSLEKFYFRMIERVFFTFIGKAKEDGL